MHRPPRPARTADTAAQTPWGWALAGALAGVLPALLAFAPAHWLATAVGRASGQQIQLQAPSGTVWTGSAHLVLDRDMAVPVLGTVNDTEPDAMRAQIDALVGRGYTTLKIKVGTDAPADALRVSAALAHVNGRALLRVDANQGYTPSQALAFSRAVPVPGIALFEQPCAAGDWDSHMAVARDCPLPLMLDESIYDEADIDRAATLSASRFVKVKLMKFVSLDRLAAAIERIRGHGMEPVLGNGVAGDIGCWMETCIAARHIGNAGEMNGWTKMRRSLLRNPLRIEQGAVQLPAGWRPLLDLESLEAQTLALHTASRH